MNTEKERLGSAPEWMARLAEGEITPAEKAAFTDWLRESPRNVRELIELTLLGEDVSKLPITTEQVDAWVREAREAAVVPMPLSRVPSRSARSVSDERLAGGRHTSRIRAIAASMMLAVLAVFAYQWQDGRYTTDLGEQKILTLADGSVVTLNTSSELKVRFSADKRALKLLKGEAFFRVAHDTARPFEVTAQGTSVKAVGTQFNVRIAPLATVVSVMDGAVEVRERVSVRPDAGSALVEPTLRLKKGEETKIHRHGTMDPGQTPSLIKAERVTVARAAAWTRGRVEFEATPLIEVLREFQRYREFNVEIAEPLRELKLTGSFDAQDPESAFAYIATLPGIVVEKQAPQSFLIRQK